MNQTTRHRRQLALAAELLASKSKAIYLDTFANINYEDDL